MSEIARLRKDWNLVAAHAAWEFSSVLNVKSSPP